MVSMGGRVCGVCVWKEGARGGGLFSRGASLSLVLNYERLPEKELENSKQRERLIYSPLSEGPDGLLSDSSSFDLPAGLSSPSAGAGAPARPLPLSQSASAAPVPSCSPQPPRSSVCDVVPLSWAHAAEASNASSLHPRRSQSITSSRGTSQRLLQDADGELIPIFMRLHLCTFSSGTPAAFNPKEIISGALR